jgi:organic hydroperoxide reductase OsmC/OhrA
VAPWPFGTATVDRFVTRRAATVHFRVDRTMEDHAWPAGGMYGVTVERTGNRGDAARWNPEDMLLASLSACLKLWCLGFVCRGLHLGRQLS